MLELVELVGIDQAKAVGQEAGRVEEGRGQSWRQLASEAVNSFAAL